MRTWTATQARQAMPASFVLPMARIEAAYCGKREEHHDAGGWRT